MHSLTHMDAAEKIVYFKVMERNDEWSESISTGFAMAKPRIQHMFKEK
ncbi:hypothetical protein GCM10011391_13460 [Pullulanibacillus camelliae]|uniref:Uncharacterized protein n=1 Tax=Pullulanibacillus camelliae TaxID=1707096 RepID=A0A8J2VR32_9BACL|nr:hypothetical protein GCM10011391_13460 [Pullulanibacillus camelliae]